MNMSIKQSRDPDSPAAELLHCDFFLNELLSMRVHEWQSWTLDCCLGDTKEKDSGQEEASVDQHIYNIKSEKVANPKYCLFLFFD